MWLESAGAGRFLGHVLVRVGQHRANSDADWPGCVEAGSYPEELVGHCSASIGCAWAPLVRAASPSCVGFSFSLFLLPLFSALDCPRAWFSLEFTCMLELRMFGLASRNGVVRPADPQLSSGHRIRSMRDVRQMSHVVQLRVSPGLPKGGYLCRRTSDQSATQVKYLSGPRRLQMGLLNETRMGM